MAKINNQLIYGLEELPSLLDYLIGSKDKNGKTKNFSLQSIVNLINGVNGQNVIQYKFYNQTTPDIDYETPGAFFTNNNETNINNFSSLILNKKSLANYDLTILFNFLSGLQDLFIGVNNPSDPNNFFLLKVTSISNQSDYFIFNVESYNNLYIGELSNELIYSFYWDTKEWISEINNINTDLNTKLNHGGYTGTGQDLKNEIDSVTSDLANNYYTKPEVDAKISSVYRFKGNVANYASLPTTGLTIGDVYNALDTDINWAWTGTVWDSLGGTMDVSGKEDKSNKQNSLVVDGTGQKYPTVDATNYGLMLKLDKGTYTGNAQDLKTAIDNIYQPNSLISSVPPIRAVNTFTFPANQYNVLINKTIRTNPAQFITTIDAATTDYKRVDLIWFKDDGTLQKTVGNESITVAQRPDIPSGQIGVPISFINVFGNVISDPTPITPEISFQDVFGTERFRGDYVRIDGVSFSPAQKLISINPLVPLSAFLDIVNGDDVTATIENSKKPFKTIEKLISSLPVTNGETYTIYITGGVVPVLRKLPIRNLTFVGYTDTTLDFTNCKENNGTTEATEVLYGTPTSIGMWTFQNQNISIICNYVGVKNFILNDQTPATRNSIIFRGTINVLDWKSTGPTSISGFAVRGESDFIVKNFYDSSQNRVNLFPILGTTILTINNLITSRRNQVAVVGTSINIDIKNITQAASNSTTLLVGGNNIRIGNVNITGIIAPRCIGQLELYGTFSSTTTIDFLEVPVITGTLLSTTYSTNSNLANTQTFRNFTGKLNGLITVGGTVVLDNANIQVDTYLIEKFVARQDVLTVRGFTTIVQNNTSVDLFRKFPSSTITDLNVVINIEGKLNSNVKSYGKNTSYTNTTYTFKEKINEVIIRSKIDIINKVLNPSNTYVIDGVITLLSGEFIDVPAGGITIAGYGFDVSQINKNVSGESIFRSPAGNSGNIVTRDIQYNSGAGSVFNLTDSDGSHAIEFNDVNFVSCSSVGTFNGYRQFTGTTCGIYSCLDGFTLSGNWTGWKMTNSNIRNFGSSGTLFKAGSGLSFSGRFYIDLNIQVVSGAKVCDFSPSNFINKYSLQVVNCYVTVGTMVADNESTPHVLAVTNSLFPNITPYSEKSKFFGNEGVKNSKETINDKAIVTLDGVQNVFNIPHVLGVIPKSIQLTFSDGSNTDFIQSQRMMDASKITIDCDNTPAAGSIIVYYSIST